MKKQLLYFLFVLMLSTGIVGNINAQVVYCDYDAVNHSFTTWDNALFDVVSNPNQSGINISDYVGQVTTSAGQWEGGFYTLDGEVDLSQGTTFTINVLSAVGGDVLLKLEKEGDNTQNHEFLATYTDIGNWQELTFDFSGAELSNTYSRIVLFFDFMGTDAGNLWFFDDITGPALKDAKKQAIAIGLPYSNIVVDGVIEEEWNEMVKYDVSIPFIGETFDGPADLDAWWKLGYSDAGIYILANVFADDENFADDTYGESWEQDLVEFYLDMNEFDLIDNNGPNDNSSYDGEYLGHYQLGVRADPNNTITNPWFNGNTAVVLNADNSYVVEVFIPWSDIPDRNGMSYSPTLGSKIGFDVCVADNDGMSNGAPRNRKVWSNDGSNSSENWFNMNDAGEITFIPKRTVEFNVNMSYQILLGNFDPATSNLDIAGSFNDWGGTPMSDPDGDEIYTTYLNWQVGEELAFKFRRNGDWDGTHEFPTGGDRYYTVQMDDNTPMYWYNDEFPSANVSDSLALVALYYATNGDFWNDNTNWLTGPVATWKGVTMHNTRVTHITLSNNNLDGEIPSEIGGLSELRYLDLGQGNVFGVIPPEIGNLTNLEWLMLSENQLTGSIPSEIGNLSSLQGLYMYDNMLSGSIPSEIGNLTTLLYLDLVVNQLSGSIPPEIGNLVNLKDLYLRNNLLSGSIPPELGNLASIENISLGSNQLSGSIPVELANLSTLSRLFLHSNNLTGSIPTEFGNLTSLTALALRDNELTGSIPDLSTATNLYYLDLFDNQLSGAIPDMTALNLSSFSIYNNYFTFNDIEPIYGLYDVISYSPQKAFEVSPSSYDIPEGGDINWDVQTLAAPTNLGGANNSYEWFLNGISLGMPSASSTFSQTGITSSDFGVYTCQVYNSVVPDLVLISSNISVGPSMSVDYFSVNYQPDVEALVGENDVYVMEFVLEVSGYTNPFTLSDITFNTATTTNDDDIANARLICYTTGTWYGVDVNNPTASFTFSDELELTEGTHYFGLYYDVDVNATVGNQLSAELETVTLSGTDYTPAEGSHDGVITVVGKRVNWVDVEMAESVYDKGTNDNPIAYFNFNVSGNTGTMNLNSIQVNSENTDDADIATNGVKLYYTNTPAFSTATQVGTSQNYSLGSLMFNSLDFDLPEGDNYFWITYDIDINATGGNALALSIPAEGISVGDKSYFAGETDFAEYCVVRPDPVVDYPYAESFEDATGSWIQVDTDDFNWTINSGSTMSTNTGPASASDGNNYFYVEASDYPNSTAILEALFDFSSLTNPHLAFDYHMYGSSIGTLSIDIFDGTSWVNNFWSMSGQQHSSSSAPWSQVVLDLSSLSGESNIAIRFRGLTGIDFNSDIAIDNIMIEDGYNMSFASATTIQDELQIVSTESTDNVILKVQVNTQDLLNPISLNSLTFNTNGTSNAIDIDDARVYYTGSSDVFSTNNHFGSDVAAPVGSFTISGSQQLTVGANYFWLVYDISPDATVGNVVDAECTQISVDGINRTLLETSPFGNRMIIADPSITLGCGDGTFKGEIEPVDDIWKSANANAGERAYWQFNAVAGAEYLFSTCQTSPYDTDLRIYNENSDEIEYNDGYGPYCSSWASSLSWIPTESGVYYIALDQFSCQLLTQDVVLEYTVNANLAPEINNPIPEQYLTEGFGSITIDISDLFIDPDGDELTYFMYDGDTDVATASLSGTTLTITEVGVGATGIYIEAFDPDGASENYVVIISNNAAANSAPTVDNPISDIVETEWFGSYDIDISTVFSDADGDVLEYYPESNNEDVVWVDIAGTTITVNEVDTGSATIVIYALDPNGGLAIEEFEFTVVYNNAPEINVPVADQNLDEGFGTVDIDISDLFVDIEGDALNYTVMDSEASIATGAVTGTTLTITEVGVGVCGIILWADDGNRLSEEHVIIVTVNAAANNAPTVIAPIADVSTDEGFVTYDIDITSVFNDADGDALSYWPESSDEDVVTVSVTGTTLTITEIASGTATILLYAMDGNGGLVADEFDFVVVHNSAPLVVMPISDKLYRSGFTSVDIDFSTVFTELDGDPLSYVVSSSALDVATVSITGTVLTITEVADGSTNVIITASDDRGGSVSEAFVVTIESNNVPSVVSPVADQSFAEGFVSSTIEIGAVFYDADGDVLSYSVSSDDAEIVSASITGSTITLTEVNSGTVDVTLTADDANGGVVSDIFTVSISGAGNNVPTVASAIADQALVEGFEVSVIDISGVFSDVDGDELTYSVTSSNGDAVAASIDGSELILIETGTGVSIITLTAYDGQGGSVVNVFNVNVAGVENTSPSIITPIADEVRNTGFTIATIDLSEVFTDVDGDLLTFTAVSDDIDVVTVSVDANLLSIHEVANGISAITVTANDGNGGSISDVFTVTVSAAVVPNNAPIVANPVADISLIEGFTTTVVSLVDVFSDSDGDVLSFSVASDNIEVATVSVSGAVLTILETGLGTANITVTAFDGQGGSVVDEIVLVINSANVAPVVANPIADVTNVEGFGSTTVDLSTVFSDSNGDNLTLLAVSGSTDVVTVSVDGNTLTISEVGVGVSIITVTANDGMGETVTDEFTVTVTANSSLGELSKSNVQVYPNPSNGVFVIETTQLSNSLSIKVVDVTGKTVYKQTSELSKTQIDISNKREGMYFLILESDESSYIHKLIIE